jgi:hypothetical protein
MTIRESIAMGVICALVSVFTLSTLDRLACRYGWRECSHRCHYCGLPLEAKR